jgi:type II secretion system protein N
LAAAEGSSATPKWGAAVAYPIGALLLTLLFIYLGFPYDLLVARHLHRIEAASRMDIEIGAVEPHVSLLGPGFELLDIRATREDSATLILNRIFVRPAWSLSWFALTPALHVDLASDVGSSEGTVTLGASGGWEGRVEGVKVRYLPLKERLANLDFDGILDADGDLHFRPAEDGGGFVGELRFDIREGSVAGPGFPIALPFETLGGNLRFGEEGELLRFEGVALEGPMLGATVEGKIGAARGASPPPLDIQVAYEARSATLASVIGGNGSIQIGGTLQRPVTRRQ